MNLRLLGTLGMIGGAGLLGVEARHIVSGTDLNGNTIDAVDQAGYLIWGLGSAFAFWALYRIGATGTGRLSRLVPWVGMLGSAAMAIGSVTEILGLTKVTSDPIIAVAWILILVGTLLAAIFALVARTWAGWRKFAPLVVVLSVPLMLFLSQLIGNPVFVVFALSWVLLGYAVFSSDEQITQRAAATA